MKLFEQEINCRQLESYKYSNRIKPFKVAVFQFDYVSNDKDKALLDKIFHKGSILAEKVNPAAANNASMKRNRTRLENNASAGLLAEYCWKKYINLKAKKNIVDYTEFTDASVQIDLVVLENNKLIEVRSSFPRNGIEFAICSMTYEFDILGPYSNSVKPGEIQKDFYIRTLFHIPAGKTFLHVAKGNGFKVYLTGGATWDMMIDDQVSKNKDLLPDDFVSQVQEEKSLYRVVPFSKSIDTVGIFDLINS